MHLTKKVLLKIFIFACFFYGAIFPQSPPENLLYKPRGKPWEDKRHEGLKSKPVSGYDIELISVKIHHREKNKQLPDILKIQFYLPLDQKNSKNPKVYFTVREIDYKHYYWMDKVIPKNPWQTNFTNIFSWKTKDVLKHPYLHSIKMKELGVLLRLKKPEPARKEWIVPAILYSSLLPKGSKKYLFTFRMRSLSNLRCTVHKGKKNKLTQIFRNVQGGKPFTFEWNSSKAFSGMYQLNIEGYFLANGEKFLKTIYFYHKKQKEKE